MRGRENMGKLVNKIRKHVRGFESEFLFCFILTFNVISLFLMTIKIAIKLDCQQIINSRSPSNYLQRINLWNSWASFLKSIFEQFFRCVEKTRGNYSSCCRHNWQPTKIVFKQINNHHHLSPFLFLVSLKRVVLINLLSIWACEISFQENNDKGFLKEIFDGFSLRYNWSFFNFFLIRLVFFTRIHSLILFIVFYLSLNLFFVEKFMTWKCLTNRTSTRFILTLNRSEKLKLNKRVLRFHF